MELAILFAELNAEVGFVDAQTDDGASFLGDHLDGLVHGIDVLRGLQDRFHDVVGGAAVGDAIQRGPDAAAFAADGMTLGAYRLALEIEKELMAGFGIAGEIRLPGLLAGLTRQAAYVEDE